MHFSNKDGSRKPRGSMSTVLFGMLLVAAFMVCALAMDIGHCVMIRTELQSACDAGALAGVEELAKNVLTNDDIQRANDHAATICGRNRAEGIHVKDSDFDTAVTVIVSPNTMPRTVTVRATRHIYHTFGKMIGAFADDITTVGVAAASRGLISVDPEQIMPISVSLNHAPTKGPQKNKPLNSYAQPDIEAGTPFTIVLNNQHEKNAAWLRWDGLNDEPLVFGQTIGVFNGVQANKVKPIEVGDHFYVPLILDGPPFNKSRVIVGVMGFRVTAVDFPLQITGTIENPVILSGEPGTPLLSQTSSDDNAFLENTMPWRIQLIQ